MPSGRRLDLLYGAHLALVLVLGTGWMLRAIETAGASRETSFAASTGGRTLALVAMVVGISAIVAVLLVTLVAFRDGRSILLLVLLGCAFASRRGPDVCDGLYAAAALALGAHWFLRGRRLRSGMERPPGAG